MMIAAPGMGALWVVGGYLATLLLFGVFSRRLLRGSSNDYFVASRSVGPFLLLMSLFGTTMTAFALVGSTGKAFERGIGVYGLMASMSGIIHPLVFFLVGIRLWAIGKRHDLVTQIQFFRRRFDSNLLGYLLFPVLVGLVIPYLLIGILGAGAVVRGISRGMFPGVFDNGAIPPWLTGAVVSLVVLGYILAGGVRAAALANALQTIVFMAVGVLAFLLVADSLGGLQKASAAVAQHAPHKLVREGNVDHLQFLTYLFVPLSVGMFPHLFQHWLTAKSAKTFRTSVIAFPLCILVVWLPCVLIGIWAAGAGFKPPGGNTNTVLAAMVGRHLDEPLVTGLLTAGILAAIMSSLDSQFVCLGTIFTHDIVIHAAGRDRFTDAQKVMLGRGFMLVIVLITYLLSLFPPPNIFDLAVWCFSGFASLFPLVFAAVYWRRVTRAGAIASVLAAAGTWGYLFHDGLLRPTLAGEKTSEDYLVFGMMPVAIMVAAATVALILVSLVTTPPPKQLVDRFFETPA
ncbi:MAG: sodium:solute symporter family protein [Planctomycetes bacterium]|nr:sodium:solute symporter family protein [Planctomycetota bacterium]